MKETDIRQGTLALMVLKTLEILGSLHGYAIARRIEQIWAGIHYPMDLVSGNQLGNSVAQIFIAWAQSDGSQ